VTQSQLSGNTLLSMPDFSVPTSLRCRKSSGCVLQCFRRYHVRSPSHVLSTTLKPYSTLITKSFFPCLFPTESPCSNHMPPLYRRHPRIRALAQDDPRIWAVAQDDLSNEQTQLPLLPLSLDYENPDCSGNYCRRQSACVIGRRSALALG
jgi:hypothetical protein